jgi:hypothetical protein
MPRRPVPALLIAAIVAVVLWFSIPAGLTSMRLAEWHWETVLAVLGAHAMVAGPLLWIAWLFWAGRRPGDGG